MRSRSGIDKLGDALHAAEAHLLDANEAATAVGDDELMELTSKLHSTAVQAGSLVEALARLHRRRAAR